MIMAKDSNNNYVKIEDIKQQNSFNGISPIEFKGSGENLENYRIYGNTISGESVGDLIAEGEHAGEFQVPVTVEGKNLLQNTATSRTTGSGITITVNDNKSVVINGTSNTGNPSGIILGGDVILDKGAYILSGCPQGGSNNTYKLFCIFDDDGERRVMTDIGDGATIVLNGDNPKVIKDGFYIYALSCDNNVFFPMLRKADITDDTYEPYQPPVTAPIYLPEQIRKVGDETEYIDYAEQKQHRIRKNLLNEEYIQGNPISNSIIRVKCKTPIPLVKGELYTISFDSGSLFDVSLGSSPTPEYPFVADTTILSSCGNSLNWLTSPYTFECVNDGYISVTIRKKDNTSITPDEVNFAIQFEKNSTATSYEPYIEDTELNVTLPALPTLFGTNILSVNTNTKPSKVWGRLSDPKDILYVKDNLGNTLFSKYHDISINGSPPLTYKAKKVGNLINYLIYGNTIEGESVGDKTDNIIRDYAVVQTQAQYAIVLFIDTELIPNTTYSFTCLLNSPELRLCINENLFNTISYVKDDVVLKVIVKTLSELPDSQKINGKWIMLKNSITEPVVPELSNIMMIKGSEMPAIYEPYGYRVPVTVSNGTDTKTTNLYLPEQIKMVGDEVEFIDFGAQKQHRVRKNLLPNTATSQTINGVTFTVNGDGSVTCNGTTLQSIELALGTTFSLLAGNYRLIGTPSSGSGSSYFLRAWYNNSGSTVWIYDTGNGYNFTLTSVTTMRSSIVIRSGQVLDNITFYPMIRKADIEDDTYEPYIINTELDITLPALPTMSGTNTLTVGTEVQPSEVDIKGKLKK